MSAGRQPGAGGQPAGQRLQARASHTQGKNYFDVFWCYLDFKYQELGKTYKSRVVPDTDFARFHIFLFLFSTY